MTEPSDSPEILNSPVTEGTHPVAMLGLVTAIAGVVTSGCICIYPPMAPMLPAICGLPAVVMGGWTLIRVRQGAWSPSNRLQGRAALALGVLDLILAAIWAWMLLSHGAGLGVDLGATP